MGNIPSWKKLYERRKANGECPKCGNKMDREGHYCSACLEKQRTETQLRRQFFRSIGICPECGKNELMGQEKVCIECHAKRQTWNEHNRKPLSEEQKKKMRDRGKQRHKERIELGLCTKCGIIKANPGKKKCGRCLIKDSELHRLKRPV